MFLYASPKVWNSLPLSLREIETLYLFKKRLKAYYFNLALGILQQFDPSILLLIAIELVSLLCINFMSVKLFKCYHGSLVRCINTCWCYLKGDIKRNYIYCNCLIKKTLACAWSGSALFCTLVPCVCAQSLSARSHSISFKELFLEIGCIQEMRTTWGNIQVPQIFFHDSPYSRKYDLIRVTPYHWHPCISQFCNITKGLLQNSTGSLGL